MKKALLLIGFISVMAGSTSAAPKKPLFYVNKDGVKTVEFEPALKQGKVWSTIDGDQLQESLKGFMEEANLKEATDLKADISNSVKRLATLAERAQVKNGSYWFLAASTTLSLWVTSLVAQQLQGVPFVAREYVPQFYAVADKLCAKVGLQNPKIHILNMPVYNAFTTANRDELSIFISQILINALTPDEFEAVIAHEIAHSLHGHVTDRALYNIVLSVPQTIIFTECVLQYTGPFARRSWKEGSYASSIGAGLGTTGALIASQIPGLLLLTAKMRKQELEADLWSAKMTGKPEALISALEKIETFNNDYLKKNPGISLGRILPEKIKKHFATHPPLKERVKALSDWAAAHKVAA